MIREIAPALAFGEFDPSGKFGRERYMPRTRFPGKLQPAPASHYRPMLQKENRIRNPPRRPKLNQPELESLRFRVRNQPRQRPKPRHSRLFSNPRLRLGARSS